MKNRKIYHVVLEYYAMSMIKMSCILKTFSSRKKAEDFTDEYKRTRSDYDCIRIEEYEVE